MKEHELHFRKGVKAQQAGHHREAVKHFKLAGDATNDQNLGDKYDAAAHRAEYKVRYGEGEGYKEHEHPYWRT